MEFDFDYFMNLYKKDPDKFNEITAKIIDDTIDTMSEVNRARHRAKQWRLQQELNKIKDPVARMNRMVAIFWEGVAKYDNTMKSLGFSTNSDNNLEKTEPSETPSCQVIEFKRKINN